MKFIDLTHPLVHGLPAFPNDPKLSIVDHATLATCTYRLSQVVMGSHQGTHLDALSHFLPDGLALDQMPLEWFFGPAHLLRLPKKAGEDITVDDFRPHEEKIQPGSRIILETGWHRNFGQQAFYENFPSLTLDAAHYLVERGIRVLGMDIPTPGREWYELHHILQRGGIVIVEALAHLDRAPDQFTFAGFPLAFQGGDGSPIRAVALCEQDGVL